MLAKLFIPSVTFISLATNFHAPGQHFFNFNFQLVIYFSSLLENDIRIIISTIDVISINLFYFFYCDHSIVCFFTSYLSVNLVNLEVKGIVISEYTTSEVI